MASIITKTSKRMIKILVVDDEASFVMVLSEELAQEGFDVSTALDGLEGIRMLEEGEFDVCILDLNMPGLNGLEVLRQASEKAVPTEFIMLTAYATIQTAADSIRLGAYDYVTKPCDLERVMVLIKKAYESRIKKEEGHVQQRTRRGSSKIITRDPGVKKLLKEAEKVARTDASVLILGESGTGKELMAEHLHSSSFRCDGPFIAFNIAAIQDNLLESELFGYEKGAFTGAVETKKGLLELADGGTIFLDEIGEIPLQTQAKLLRAIEKGSFYKVGGTRELHTDVRIVAATNKDLRKMANENAFREDLYYRLSSITFTMPPLRERKEDIPLLVDNFLAKLPVGYKKDMEQEAVKAMLNYDWPGNVRELQNVLNRAAILSDTDCIRKENLPPELKSTQPCPSLDGPMPTLEEMEKEHISRVLSHTGGQRNRAAEILGIDVKTLYRKLKRYHID